jgi:hypothetical protein
MFRFSPLVGARLQRVPHKRRECNEMKKIDEYLHEMNKGMVTKSFCHAYRGSLIVLSVQLS